MIKNVTSLLLFTCTLIAHGISVTVDENIEFISAVARLSGFDEYNNNVNKSYVAQIDSLLAPYESHPAVKYFQKVRSEQGVSYDAIATLSVHTAIDNNNLIYLPNSEICKMDDRWKTGQGDEFVRLLNDLYTKSQFHKLYSSNLDFYEKVTTNMEDLIKSTDVDWLNGFYGKKLAHSRVVCSLLNYGSYGTTMRRKGQPDEAVIIIGCHRLDENNIPIFPGQQSLIIHEVSHPICNPLVEANLNQFNNKITTAAELMKEKLQRQAYAGASTMLCESMVRGAELQYRLAHATNINDTMTIQNRLRNEMSNGFMFMPEVMEAYDLNKGNIVDSMMPALIRLINEVDINSRYSEIINGSPKILGCSIAENAKNINPSDSLEIKIFFDQPIDGHSFGMNYLDDRKDIMPELASSKGRISLDNSHRILTMKVIAEPNKEYGFVVEGYFFRGAKGYKGHGATRVHFFTSSR